MSIGPEKAWVLFRDQWTPPSGLSAVVLHIFTTARDGESNIFKNRRRRSEAILVKSSKLLRKDHSEVSIGPEKAWVLFRDQWTPPSGLSAVVLHIFTTARDGETKILYMRPFWLGTPPTWPGAFGRGGKIGVALVLYSGFLPQDHYLKLELVPYSQWSRTD